MARTSHARPAADDIHPIQNRLVDGRWAKVCPGYYDCRNGVVMQAHTTVAALYCNYNYVETLPTFITGRCVNGQARPQYTIHNTREMGNAKRVRGSSVSSPLLRAYICTLIRNTTVGSRAVQLRLQTRPRDPGTGPGPPFVLSLILARDLKLCISAGT